MENKIKIISLIGAGIIAFAIPTSIAKVEENRKSAQKNAGVSEICNVKREQSPIVSIMPTSEDTTKTDVSLYTKEESKTKKEKSTTVEGSKAETKKESNSTTSLRAYVTEDFEKSNSDVIMIKPDVRLSSKDGIEIFFTYVNAFPTENFVSIGFNVINRSENDDMKIIKDRFLFTDNFGNDLILYPIGDKAVFNRTFSNRERYVMSGLNFGYDNKATSITISYLFDDGTKDTVTIPLTQ